MNRAVILDLLTQHGEQLRDRFGAEHVASAAHRYFALDPEVVWSIVQTKIPALSRAARRVLSEADQSDIAGDGT